MSAADISSHHDLTRFSPTPVHLPTGYLKGRVLAPDGHPVPDAEVDVHSTADVPPYLQGFTEWTDEKGRFKFELPPGTYLLGVNLEAPPSPAVPFPATYYPSALHEPAAKSVSVADRQKIGGLTIRIPERLRERKIPVRVTWPDGRPVADANVWLAEVGNPSAVVGWAVSHTTAEGTFVLTGFEGIDYFVHGSIYVKPSYKPYCADAITVRSGGEISDAILLVLSREGDVCRGW